ncbi:NAD-dependent epimerase/dehydratase family protein [Solimonas sp. SE-A11]|uniref:NAD-dependent epimerase/dehydratase family protein n=1 Tax=Solimonas sp. SE-A11 TaxID=3054954 RepID=UPI00259CD729|nr:NAD-dependent epimerase/dehydratase family protein [Solimonas sp. SE-A11]MDM4771328.1 NAD-dependent epimerase/dehydratase family protein [Solimonas sp. SE-A11]
MRTAVTGGGGRLGCALVRALLAAGHSVRVLEPPGRGMPRSLQGLEVEMVHGSVLSAEDVARLLEAVDCVFHLAAKVSIEPDRDGSMQRVNVEGTRIVAEACTARGIRLVHCSSHSALEHRPLALPLDETRVLNMKGRSDYSRTKAEAETLVQRLVQERGLDAVVCMPGNMIGPEDYEPSIFGRALLDLYHRRIPVMMEVVSDYVDARDVAAGFVAAATRGRRGERYLLTGEVLDMRRFLAVWEEVSGVPMPRTVLPLWVGWASLPLALAAARLSGQPPKFNAGVLRQAVLNRVVLNDKARSELGFSPRPPRESLRDAMVFLKAEGWLEAPSA